MSDLNNTLNRNGMNTIELCVSLAYHFSMSLEYLIVEERDKVIQRILQNSVGTEVPLGELL